MSIEFLNAAFLTPITGAKKAVLIALCDRASYVGFCYPSMDDIALRSGCSKRTAIRAVEELEVLGYLVVSRQAGKPNKYILSAEKLSATRDSMSPDKVINSDDTVSMSSDMLSKKRCHDVTQTTNNHQEPKRAREVVGGVTVTKSGKPKPTNGDRTVVTNGHAYALFKPQPELRKADSNMVVNELTNIKNILAGTRH